MPRSEAWVHGALEADGERRELRRDGIRVPLGPRAYDVLETLLNAAGNLVSREEVLQAVWPGQHVEANTLDVHMARLRAALGPDRALLRTEHGRGYRLLGDWRRAGGAADLAALAAPAPTLPSLLGRHAELAAVQALLRPGLCVTLAGTGGIGKTQLASEAARRAAASLGTTAHFADLTPVSDPDRIASAVADAFALREGAQKMTPERLAAWLGGRRALLVLDNCEHVVDAAAVLAATLLARCPDLILLATSRESLRLAEERVWRVPPLSVPAPEERDPDAIRQHGSVALFLLRMAQAGGPGELPPRELEAAAEVCRRLDGLPLAIEFAAARAAALGASGVLAGLSSSLSILSGRRRGGQERHATMRAALDWSHRLLPEAERRLLRRLGVFTGGFTLDAAVSVAGGGEAARAEIVEGIGSLAAKSLLIRDEREEGGRWRLLETIRGYALERLVEEGELDQMRARHARFFRALAQPALEGEATQTLLRAVAGDVDNLRAALDWSFSSAGDVTEGVLIVAGAVPVWLRLLRLAECAARTGQALLALERGVALDPSQAVRVRLALCFALLNTDAPPARIRPVLETALAMVAGSADPELRLRALWARWSFHLNAGNCPDTLEAAREFLALAEASGQRSRLPVAHRLLGTAEHFAANQEKATAHLDIALGHGTEARRAWFLLDQTIVARAMRARVLLLRGFLDRAEEEAQRSLADAEESGHLLSVCYALRNGVCSVAFGRGDLASAEAAAERLREISERLALTFWTDWASCLRGQVAVASGYTREGTELLRAGLERRSRDGWLMRTPEFLASLAQGLARLGDQGGAEAAVAEALAICLSGRQRWCLPLVRLAQAKLLPAAGARRAAEAAVAEAQAGGALLFALHGALELHRIARDARSRDGLAAVMAGFSEGLESPALKEARAALGAA